MKDLISVIVPCYNLENYIENTIRSVLNSSHHDIELLLINDGSTDNTLNIIKQYEASDHRVKIINKKNEGVSSARNMGIKASTGEYIYFLDGDDSIKGDLFEVALKVFKGNNEIDIFSFGFDIVNENDIQLKNYSFQKYHNRKFTNEDFLNLFFTKKLRQHICSLIVKKEVLINNQIIFSQDVSYSEDQEVQVKILLNSHFIYYNATAYFHYLKRETSAMNSLKINFDSLIVFRRLKLYLEQKTNTIKLKHNFNNYTALFFIIKWKDGIKNKRDKRYFDELDTFSECLKETKFIYHKYGAMTYLFSKFYFLWKIFK